MSAGDRVRNYLDWLLSIRGAKSKVKDLEAAQAVLDSDLQAERGQDRIVRTSRCSRAPTSDRTDPVPGRTSRRRQDLARQVVAATGREFIRVSLGGVRDEPNPRSPPHLYQLVPGKIIQSCGRRRPRIRCSCWTNRQDGRRFPRRSVVGAARGPGSSRTRPSTTTTLRSTTTCPT